MNVTVQKKDKGQRLLTVELSPDEMQPYLERAATALSAEHRIEGFRPGKASLGIVTQRLGAQAVWQSAAEFAVRKTFGRAVLDQQLETVGRPQVSIVKLAPDNPFIYSAEVTVIPDLTLGDYKTLKAKQEPMAVTADQIDHALDDLQAMFATEALVDRPAQKDDKVEVDFDLSVDHMPVEQGSSRQHPMVIGSGHFIPGFEDNLVGMKKDDKKEFTLTFPKDYNRPEVAGKEGSFAVTMKSVFAVTKPEINDDFAKRAGKFATVAELRAKIEANLQAEADGAADRKLETAIVDELIARATLAELPTLVVDAELEKIMAEMKDEVSRQGGITFEDYLLGLKKTADELKKEFRPQAERRVKSALIIRAIAKAERIVVDDAAVEAEVQETLKMYDKEPSLKERIDSADYRDYVRTILTNRKVMDFLKSRIAATEKEQQT